MLPIEKPEILQHQWLAKDHRNPPYVGVLGGLGDCRIDRATRVVLDGKDVPLAAIDDNAHDLVDVAVERKWVKRLVFKSRGK